MRRIILSPSSAGEIIKKSDQLENEYQGVVGNENNVPNIPFYFSLFSFTYKSIMLFQRKINTVKNICSYILHEVGEHIVGEYFERGAIQKGLKQ